MKEFEMKDLGNMDVYLGLKVVLDFENCQIKISQQSFIRNLLKHFGAESCNGIDIPMEAKLVSPKSLDENRIKHAYKELIVCLCILRLLRDLISMNV